MTNTHDMRPIEARQETGEDIVARILEGVLEHRRLGARILFAYVHDDNEKHVACDDRMIDFPTLRMGRARLPHRDDRLGDTAIVVILSTPFIGKDEVRVSLEPIQWPWP